MLFASLVPFSRRRVSKRSEAQTVARARSRVGVLAMSNSVEDGIIVELDGDEIVVWKPGTVFLIALKKPDHQRHLVVVRSWLADFTSKPLAEFRALAAQLAVNKARSLGWIVEAILASKQNKFRRPVIQALPMMENLTREGVVVVIDDDASVRAALKELFGSVGLEVRLYASAGAFLEARIPDTTSCLVIDVRLPE